MNKNQAQIIQLATELGITNQLYTTRMTELLSRQDLTIAQFSLLQHMLRLGPKEHTITELTAALEINQPGVTKIIKKLGQLGYVAVEASKSDSRKKLISLTEVGAQTAQKVMMSMGPDVLAWFADWEAAELEQFTDHLQKLRKWLDANRLQG